MLCESHMQGRVDSPTAEYVVEALKRSQYGWDTAEHGASWVLATVERAAKETP